jgi:hypothetical protein
VKSIPYGKRRFPSLVGILSASVSAYGFFLRLLCFYQRRRVAFSARLPIESDILFKSKFEWNRRVSAMFRAILKRVAPAAQTHRLRALSLCGPHPDDIEVACAPTVLA